MKTPEKLVGEETRTNYGRDLGKNIKGTEGRIMDETGMGRNWDVTEL